MVDVMAGEKPRVSDVGATTTSATGAETAHIDPTGVPLTTEAAGIGDGPSSVGKGQEMIIDRHPVRIW